MAPHVEHEKDAELAMLKELALVAYATDQSTDSRELQDVKDDITEDKTVADGAVDVRGRPSIKSRTGNWKACWPIFGWFHLSWCT
jgi:hypothetical protein